LSASPPPARPPGNSGAQPPFSARQHHAPHVLAPSARAVAARALSREAGGAKVQQQGKKRAYITLRAA
jgi:hypothetical protein